jgi:ketosteroid isomerase-like protein
VGTTSSPRGTSKYVVLYERQADGSLKLAVDAVTADSD